VGLGEFAVGCYVGLKFEHTISGRLRAELF
jgi:hypothetical protein